ncbi:MULTISPECIES: FAD-dependent monooxygenase [Lactiplantibacillus]|uniref:FAD-dependent monooxygenase n=1 Tax=Lactiplantibacillus pentosus TaxID=1589 RepID=A0ABD7IQM6_LACPE|nr:MULTISPECIES: NAD(P)/FAD-dependent oxidoreductase [Lactiplantibacillus]MCM8608639.1 FAD-dependent monooxygenase [Lactiplantibacillus sp. B652]PRO94400.1 hypothetical protein C6Y08_10855 [Lactiplantibacillus pentosus]RMW47610.1 FAD-dependent monooxygenase [Lactiplantibacillus pentosus]
MSQIKTAIVVGGSLAGMMMALALAKSGVKVTVLERHSTNERRGAVLSVHSGAINQSALAHELRAIAAGDGRGIESWRMIHQRLQSEAHNTPNIDVHFNESVQDVGENRTYAYAQTNQAKYQADILVGADGGSSLVRKYVNPQQPNAIFAGYQLWVAIVEEELVPKNLWPGKRYSDFQEFDGADDDFLFAMIVPGMDGSREVGHRQIGLAWYDNGSNDVLYQSGAVQNNHVLHTLNTRSIPQEIRMQLIGRAQKYFPPLFAKAIQVAIEREYLVATPISEYVASKMSRGRVTIVGDAAHALTPMTGKGFNSSLDDAATLGGLISKYDDANQLLQKFEDLRMPIDTEIVRSGQSFSQSYGRE